MSYNIGDDLITITSQSVTTFWKRMVATLAFCFLCALMLYEGYEKLLSDFKGEDGVSFLGLLSVLIYLSNYAFFRYKKIVISDKEFKYTSYKLGEEYVVNFKSVSKVLLSDDNFIIYDMMNDTDKVVDLNYFSHDEIQILVNVVCKKIPVVIEEDYAQEMKISLPDYAVSENNTASQRTREKPGDIEPEHREDITPARKRIVVNEIPVPKNSNDVPGPMSSGKRRLEL